MLAHNVFQLDTIMFLFTKYFAFQIPKRYHFWRVFNAVFFISVKGGPHPCVVCKVVVDHSRPVQKSQIGQLGIKEEDFSPETRVCNNCWCKNIRKKHAHCPLPSCTTSKGRVKGRLRHLPTKLNDLPKSSKESLVNEFRK